MILWQTATAIFFAYTAFVAVLMPRLAWRRKLQSVAGAAVGMLVIYAAVRVQHPLLNDWVIPPLALLLAYWTSGLLFVGPMHRAESLLLEIDQRLQLRRICRSTPRPLAEFLEISYAAVYLVIPIALVIHLAGVSQANGALFWAVILITDYICFGTLPWIQTRPPRVLEAGEPWRAAFRTFNLRLLGRTSIHVNTFPSGHAAEGLTAALMVIGAPAPIVALMFLAAVSISAGAVLGRYHYATDIGAGWVVAIAVYLVVSR
jgi:membrane-associated phospholipid phosphatase